ncbi:hypothetical protein KM427_05950 [Nocardioides sp. LMS-CY]|uniref:hypothetical protein n=1 Tax=Nocardioides sp. (strain LMS-CY) TaxID=2840457 RepID=UPI001C000448|nr:hypothetical protein [Nocardioides sp. LMS-CY]QWF23267.1 hypothetical protein KM427_05950 [Nocardioides sp. LMS-CY]
MTSVARGPRPGQRQRLPHLGPRMRLWGWWTAWRVDRLVTVDECEHDGRTPMCWACVLLCCQIR